MGAQDEEWAAPHSLPSRTAWHSFPTAERFSERHLTTGEAFDHEESVH
jgi:hypothetical protein